MYIYKTNQTLFPNMLENYRLLITYSNFSSVQLLSRVWLFVIPWTVAMEFSRQEYWSGLPFPSAGHLPNPGIEPESPVSPALQADSLPIEPLGKPFVPLPGIKPSSPTAEAWSLNHWTAREFPYRFFFYFLDYVLRSTKVFSS